jgi:hypothetical protein
MRYKRRTEIPSPYAPGEGKLEEIVDGSRCYLSRYLSRRERSSAAESGDRVRGAPEPIDLD